MNKEEVLKELFQLPKDEILDIFKIINGYKTAVNKRKPDTLLMRQIFVAGYHSIGEFYKNNEFTRDCNISDALNYGTININAYLKLKNILNIDDEIFKKIIEEIEEIDSNDKD